MSIAEEIAALAASGSLSELQSRLAKYAQSPAEQKIELVRRIEQLHATGKLSSRDTIECLRILQSGDQTLLLTPDVRAQNDSDATAALVSKVIESQETLIRPQPIEAGTARIQDNVGIFTAANATIGPHSKPGIQATFARDKTQVLSDRLIQSLDEVDAVHHGPVEPGTVIKKRFLLERVLGKGGMGVVFAAIDRRKQEARDPNPFVALKLLNADFARHPQSFIALQREARKAQTLAHPNVATVFDFDRDGDAVYLTMELLEGRSLDAITREARGVGVGAELALPIIRGIAEGLAYAHRKGIVHSDLKPGNIFLTDDGTPKILDFGIARAVPTPGEQLVDEFDAGSLGAYTEAYATHEMVEGVDPHPTDDMYALGIIAYELLTGCHPYNRNSAVQARELAIKCPPLKGIKRKQARAIESCLSLDRRGRPQDAGQFLKAFRGPSVLQRLALGAAAVFAVTAMYLGYQNYVETGPTIAFSQLPIDKQQEFKQKMSEGDAAWKFFEHDHIGDALDSAIDFYADAYAVHPRNREAVSALNKAADAVLRAASDPEMKRDLARKLQERSDYYRKYAPVVEAAEDAR